MNDTPRAHHESALAHRQREAARCAANERRLSNARLAVFGLGGVAAVLVVRGVTAGVVLGAAAVGVFIALAVVHEQVIRRHERARRAIAFHERGLARIDHRFAGTGQTGLAHAPAHHPYASDLDLFGEGSLFEWLCTARTVGGEARLASWLLAPAAPDVVARREVAVEELRPRTGLREDWALLAEDLRVDLHPETLEAWGNAAPMGLTRFHAGAAAALAVAGVAALAAWTLGASLVWLLTAIAFDLAFAAGLRERVAAVLRSVETPARQLAVLSGLMARLESESFACEPLRELRARTRRTHRTPSREIDRLRRRLELVDSRRNAFFAPLAGLLLWGTQFACAIERWRCDVGPHLAEWIDVLSELEALLSLAGNAFEQADAVVPEFRSGGPCLEARGLGHPLISPETRVRNDIALDADRPLWIVSGSNMSGKSTWLRTIGVNAVLAQAGARVCATSLTLSPLQVGASIRIVDSLQEGASHFFAEIQRLRAILELADGPLPTLFLLDEILHGTNSRDRAIGAEAVVRALVLRGAIGLVTTHDLALAGIADRLGDRAANVHFSDRLVDGEMSFDYRVRAGVVERSNALDLMRSVGLPID